MGEIATKFARRLFRRRANKHFMEKRDDPGHPLIAGITKVRNEAHIIQDTLDNWAQWCDELYIYDDASIDDTAEICERHPAVQEVIASSLLDTDRLRAEWYNRQLILSSVQRFSPEWIAYFDGDEHLFAFDRNLLRDPGVGVIATQWRDMYITPEDAHLPDAQYQQRRWCSTEYRQIPFFFRNDQPLSFDKPDQRIMNHSRPSSFYPTSGLVQHWSKGYSEELWERKVQYYGTEFGRYTDKWRARKGGAVHDYVSDDGNPLQLWEEALAETGGVLV